nr:MAG TPA: hypothetical protein [Caudoviricetes sp.]
MKLETLSGQKKIQRDFVYRPIQRPFRRFENAGLH